MKAVFSLFEEVRPAAERAKETRTSLLLDFTWMAGLPAAAASAAAQAVEAAGATLASGSSSSSLLVFLVPLFFPPSFLLLLLVAFVVLFVVSVLLRYLTILHARRQQQILRTTAAALPSLPGSFGGVESVCFPGKRPFVVEGLSLLAVLTKDVSVPLQGSSQTNRVGVFSTESAGGYSAFRFCVFMCFSLVLVKPIHVPREGTRGVQG